MIDEYGRPGGDTSSAGESRIRRREIGRRRDHRSLQVALDVYSLDRALEVIRVAINAGVDFIEVGDPLLDIG